MNKTVGKNEKLSLEFGKEYILKVVEDELKLIEIESQVAELEKDKIELLKMLRLVCGHNLRTGWVGCRSFMTGKDGCRFAEEETCGIWKVLKKYDDRKEQEI